MSAVNNNISVSWIENILVENPKIDFKLVTCSDQWYCEKYLYGGIRYISKTLEFLNTYYSKGNKTNTPVYVRRYSLLK